MLGLPDDRDGFTPTDSLDHCDGYPKTVGLETIIRYEVMIEFTFGLMTKDYTKRPTAEIKIERLKRDKYSDEIGRERIFRGTLGLLSRSGVKDCVALCSRRLSLVPSPVEPESTAKEVWRTNRERWEDLIDDACNKALDFNSTHLRPRPAGLEAPTRDRPAYQLFPILPSRQPTIMYGHGGAGKSWVALYLAALVDNGLSANGFTPDPGRSLYIDYETDLETQSERAWALKQGTPELAPEWTVEYQPGRGPMVDWIDDLATYVEREPFDLVVVDSFGLALGGDANDAETVLDFFRALRLVKATVLLVDHMPKGEDAVQRGAYGSVYKRNSARSVWELRGQDGSIAAFHRKANNSRLFSPIGLNLAIEEDEFRRPTSARFTKCDVSEIPGLERGMTISQRIRAALSDGALTLDDIRESLPDVSDSSVKATLHKMVNGNHVEKLGRGLYGLAVQGHHPE